MAKRNKNERTEGSPAAAESPTPAVAEGAAPAAGNAALRALGAAGMFILDRLNSVVMGVSLLAVVLVWVAVGTFDIVLQTFDFSMLDWYVWWPFLAVLYLMCLNLAVVTFRRIPFNLPNLGVWVIHGSILLIAFGSTWFGYNWVDAVTRIDRGKTQSQAYDQTDHGSVIHLYARDRRSHLSPHADDNTGYSPNDLSEQVAIPGRLPQHVFRGGLLLTDKSIRTLREAGVPEPVIAKLNKLRLTAKRFGEGEDLRAKLSEALTAEEAAAHATAIVESAVAEEYKLGPFDAGRGLRLTINKAWPYVDYTNVPEDAGAEAELHPAVVSFLGGTEEIRRQTRLLQVAEDPIARRVELRGEEEMLADLGRILRPAYDAAARKDHGEHENQSQRWAAALNGTHADPPIARLMTWRAEPTADAQIAQVVKFFRHPPKFDGPGARQNQQLAEAIAALPFAPPSMVTRLYILDPRLEQPLPLFLDDWEARKEIRLDAVGLPDDKLILEHCHRDPSGGLIVQYRAESRGEVMHRLSQGRFTIDMDRARELGLVGNANANPARLFEAAIPFTAKLNIIGVSFRTIAVQLITEEKGRDVEALVWSVEPGFGPRPAVRGLQGQYQVPLGRDFLPVSIGVYRNIAWKAKVAPLAVGSDRVPRALHMTAEYEYTEGGRTKTWRQDFWIPKIDLPDIRRFETPDACVRLNVPKLGPIELAFGGRRVPLGPSGKLKAKLEVFQLDTLPGGPGPEGTPREYSSFVTFTNPGDAPQTVKICMNAPKKADGWWFSQNAYDPRGLRWTILSVAYKPMWSDPPLVPYAMVTMVCGVLWAFLVKPVILKHRRERNRQSGSEKAAAGAAKA
jgi:hypothetical protein